MSGEHIRGIPRTYEKEITLADTPYTLSVGFNCVKVDTTGGNVRVNLPNVNYPIDVIKTSSDSYIVTIWVSGVQKATVAGELSKITIENSEVTADEPWYPYDVIVGIAGVSGDGGEILAKDRFGRVIAGGRGVAGTDDRTVLQSTMDIYHRIYFNDELVIDSPLVPSLNNQELRGGPVACLKMSDASNNHCISSSNAISDLHLHDFEIDMNRANNSTLYGKSAILLGPVDGVTIERVYIHDMRYAAGQLNSAINLVNCANAHIRYCSIDTVGDYGIAMYSCIRSSIENNHIKDVAAHGIVVGYVATRSTVDIVGNTIKWSESALAPADAIRIANLDFSSISRNKISCFDSNGSVAIVSESSYSDYHDGIDIGFNKIDGFITGISLYGAINSDIYNNTAAISSSGIMLRKSTIGALIASTGNGISENKITFDTGIAGSGDGITVDGGSDNDICNNFIYDSRANGIVLSTSGCVNNTISGNHIYRSARTGVVYLGNYGIVANNIIRESSQLLTNTYRGIELSSGSIYNVINGNEVIDTLAAKSQCSILESSSCDYNCIMHNILIGAQYRSIYPVGTNTKFFLNRGYIAPGESRSASGVLTAGVANAIAFAWHNPELQDILIKKVTIRITTPGGTAGSLLDVGIADDAAGTNRGTEFFDDIDLNAAAIVKSTVATPGTQTVEVFCQDSVSATDGWIVGQILVANAASLAGSYYIEYEGA